MLLKSGRPVTLSSCIFTPDVMQASGRWTYPMTRGEHTSTIGIRSFELFSAFIIYIHNQFKYACYGNVSFELMYFICIFSGL